VPQRRPRGRSSRNLTPAQLARKGALAASLAVLPLATGCDAGGDASEDRSKASRKPGPVASVVAPADVEVLANLTGCKVKIRTEAEELREGACHTDDGDYLITTFPEEKFKLTWLDSAAIYGGTYLVGPRWAISARPKTLEPLRAKVGGTIRRLRGTDGTGPATGSP